MGGGTTLILWLYDIDPGAVRHWAEVGTMPVCVQYDIGQCPTIMVARQYDIVSGAVRHCSTAHPTWVPGRYCMDRGLVRHGSRADRHWLRVARHCSWGEVTLFLTETRSLSGACCGCLHGGNTGRNHARCPARREPRVRLGRRREPALACPMAGWPLIFPTDFAHRSPKLSAIPWGQALVDPAI